MWKRPRRSGIRRRGEASFLWIGSTEWQLPPPRDVPSAHLSADLAEDPHFREAHGFMQADRGIVGKRDAGDRRVIPSGLQSDQKLAIEGLADSLTLELA